MIYDQAVLHCMLKQYVCSIICLSLIYQFYLLQANVNYKSYCYNVTYSPYQNSPNNVLIMDSVWRRRACCLVSKNGTVTGLFEPQAIPYQDVQINTTTHFSLECFLDEHFQGAPLTFPATVTRGQDVFCRVTADTWDEKMFLVVPNCRFTNSPTEEVVFFFLDDKSVFSFINLCPE